MVEALALSSCDDCAFALVEGEGEEWGGISPYMSRDLFGFVACLSDLHCCLLCCFLR